VGAKCRVSLRVRAYLPPSQSELPGGQVVALSRTATAWPDNNNVVLVGEVAPLKSRGHGGD
jgi:hypothetical protein